MAATDATPHPVKNQAYRVYFPIFDNDGDLVADAASLDSEISIDGATAADCTNEATQIESSWGVYYLELTATEMNSSCSIVKVKSSTSDSKDTVLTLYPIEEGDFGSATHTKLSSVQTDIGNLNDITANAVTNDIDQNSTQLASILADTADIQANYAQASAVTTVDTQTDAIASIQTAVDAIQTVTDNLPDSGALTTINDYVDGIPSVQTAVDTIQAKTDNLPTDPADDSDIDAKLASIQTDIGNLNDIAVTDILSDSTAFAGAKIASIQTDIGALNNIAAVDVTNHIDANSTQLVSILADTADIQPNYAQASAVTGVLTKTTSVQTDIGALNDLSAAQVNAEVVDALNTDTYAEASAVPSATASITDKIGFMATAMRNKITSTSALMSIYADDGSTTVATSTISDDGTTATRGEFS